LSKLNVNVGDEFPLDGDVAMGHSGGHHGCGHRSDVSREVWREWKREQHEMRARWRQEWREKFHAFRERLRDGRDFRNTKEENNA
jgi:hypothetical protein